MDPSAERRVREEWDTGRIHHGETLEHASNWPLFDPAWLLDRQDLTVVGERRVAGREGIVVEADEPAGFLLPGSNRCVGVADRVRGVILSAEAWLDRELLMVEEFLEVVFNEHQDPDLFVTR
jgi:hypothetical protein